MVLADSHRLSRIRCYSGTRIGVCAVFAYGALTHCGVSFQDTSANWQICNSVEDLTLLPFGPTTPGLQRRQAWHRLGLGSSRFARRYSGSRCCFPFLGLLRCFSSPGSLGRPYVFRPAWYPMTGTRFPYSDIHGSELDRQLTVAFRSRPRPSSVVGAKAFTVGP